MKGMVFMSRYTPGLANAADVALEVGDKCRWRKEAWRDGGSGPIVSIEIKSELKRHSNGCYGYEAIFADDGQLGFADERSIIDWEGKR